MTKVVWIVMLLLIVAIGVPAAAIKQEKDKGTKPKQEIARAVLVPTNVKRQIVVPPCGTGVPVTSTDPAELAKTPGSISFVLKRGRGDRILLIPRCRASQGAAPSEGANLPSAAFLLPVAANLDAGRGGSVEAGAAVRQGAIPGPPHPRIQTRLRPQCIQ